MCSSSWSPALTPSSNRCAAANFQTHAACLGTDPLLRDTRPAAQIKPLLSSVDMATQGCCLVQAAFAKAAYEAVCKEYTRIEEAIADPYRGSQDGFEQRWLV